MKKTLPFLALISVLALSCSKQRADIIEVDSNDAEMNAAIKKGRETFGLFKEEFKKDPEFGGLVKVYFTESGANGEHMWVQPINLESEKMTGTLLDVPGWLTNVKQGDPVTFTLNDVSDWLYVKNGKAVGAYSVRLLRSRMTEVERKEHDSGYPFSFD